MVDGGSAVMARFYICTGFGNKIQHNYLRDALVELGHEITHDWTFVVHGESDDPDWTQHASDDAQGVADADFVPVILPGGLGTHTEMGMALALGKPIFLLTIDPYLRDKIDGNECPSPFYHLPTVHLICPVEGLISPSGEPRLLIRDAAITLQGLWLALGNG